MNGSHCKDSKTVIREPARSVVLAGKYDVIVAGGGPAGFAAALRAAREGCKTLLLEKSECLGGIWTSGLMPWIIDARNKTGILQEICAVLKDRGGRWWIRENAFTAPPEELRYLLEQLCLQAGVVIRYGTVVCHAVTDGRKLEYVITESKSGREAWQGTFYIDATGDGDLAALAGCEFEYGNAEGMAQPASLIALLGGIDPEKQSGFIVNTDGESAKEKLLEAMRKAGIDPSYSQPTLFHYGCGIAGLMSHHAYGVVPFDADSRTRAIISGRDELHRQINALRMLPGWEKLVLLGTAAQLGIREGRRVKGRAKVTQETLESQRFPSDTVCIPTFCVDIHAPNPKECKSILQDRPDIPAAGYGIPFRALLSFDLDNLLLAGRCISGDFCMHASYRVTGNAVPLGEAAGFGAAVAAKNNIPLEAVGGVPCFSGNEISE